MTKQDQQAIFERSIDPQLLESLRNTPNILNDNPSLLEIQSRLNQSFEEDSSNPFAAHVSMADWIVPATETTEAVSIRCYTPKITPQHKPLPVLLWIHGGGFIAGNVPSDDPICQRFAVQCNCAVISVEYRLAPQNPFPAGFNDCYAALQWLAGDGALKLNINIDNLAVGGGSAGGCLAAGIVLKACETGGPKIKHQLLMVPVLDDRHQTPSSKDIIDYRVTWNRELSLLAWNGYLKNISEEESRYFAPARVKVIPNLPSTFISVEEQDLLRDEGIIYAQRLMQSGVTTELHVYPGTFHGSFLIESDADVSRQHLADAVNSLRRSLHKNDDLTDDTFQLASND